MIATAMAPEGEHAAPQVVVQVLEQHRGAGGGGRGVLERLGLHDGHRPARLAAPSSSSEALPTRRVMIWAWLSSGKNGPQRLADLAPVVEQQELDPLGVLEACARPGTASMRSSVVTASSRRSAWAAGSGSRSRAPSSAWPATLWVTSPESGCVTMFWVNSQGGERADDGEHAVGVAQVLLDLLHVGDVLGREQVGDRLALVHGEQAHHGLAAEQVLVGDAVLVDLLVLVQVRVLAGGEVELGDAEPEHQRDRQADHADDARRACRS